MGENNNKMRDNLSELATDQSNKDTQLSKKMKMMENRLKESLKSMMEETMKEALKPIQDSIDKLQATQTTMETHEQQIAKLQMENATLVEKVNYLKTEMNDVHAKLNKLEDRSLECNLIFHGIKEQSTDDQEARIEKVYRAFSNTINRDTPLEHLQVAREVEIVRTRRLGKAELGKTRPLCVEFSSRFDSGKIYSNWFSIKQGIYVDREFSYETEKDRRLLRPILKATKGLKEYNCKSRLEGSQLVIDGKRYTKKNLDQLPQSLNIMKVMTKSNEHRILWRTLSS